MKMVHGSRWNNHSDGAYLSKVERYGDRRGTGMVLADLA